MRDDRTAVIVGHGPSLRGAKLGKRIDDCNWVIRLKNCSILLEDREDFGTRTDVMCSSTEVIGVIRRVKAREYWGYPKKGHYDAVRVASLVPEAIIPLEACNLWNAFFREMGASHPNVSTGLGALIIALDRLPVDTVYLAGFDNVLNPSISGYRCTVPTAFNSGGTKDTGHDWQKEHELLPYLAAHFRKQIKDLAGSWKTDARGNDIQPEGVREVRAQDVGGHG